MTKILLRAQFTGEDMKTHIYIVRHGRQNSRLCNVDVPLSPEGREQADLAGARIKAYSPQIIYASDLKRAVETAEIINSHLGLEMEIRPDIREADFGDLTGHTDEYIHKHYGDFFLRRARMEKDLPYPGGENCEAVFNRSIKVVDEIINKQYERVVMVAHGGTIRALLTGLVGAPFENWITFGRSIENCSITEIMYDSDRKSYHIERVNDYSHIEGHEKLLRKYFSKGY